MQSNSHPTMFEFSASGGGSTDDSHERRGRMSGFKRGDDGFASGASGLALITTAGSHPARKERRRPLGLVESAGAGDGLEVKGALALLVRFNPCLSGKTRGFRTDLTGSFWGLRELKMRRRPPSLPAASFSAGGGGGLSPSLLGDSDSGVGGVGSAATSHAGRRGVGGKEERSLVCRILARWYLPHGKRFLYVVSTNVVADAVVGIESARGLRNEPE